jgi:hypothetical protein
MQPLGRKRDPFTNANGRSLMIETKSQQRHGVVVGSVKNDEIVRDKTGDGKVIPLLERLLLHGLSRIHSVWTVFRPLKS